jgi:malate synthase
MEDAATAEISRSQIWQWTRHGSQLDDGRAVTRDVVRQIAAEESQRLTDGFAGNATTSDRYKSAASLFEQVALADDFVEFLTIPAYAQID